VYVTTCTEVMPCAARTWAENAGAVSLPSPPSSKLILLGTKVDIDDTRSDGMPQRVAAAYDSWSVRGRRGNLRTSMGLER